MSLDQILCFKHRRKVARDTTVKYNWRTLQLLPGKERPSYAGAQLEVHEGLDGQLLVQYRGRTIPTQERRRALEFSVPPMVLSGMAPALTVGSTAWAATQGEPGIPRRHRGRQRHIERRRQSSQASGIATQETHAATEGPVEGRAAG